jgi:predicted O-methyltransferase YrrM
VASWWRKAGLAAATAAALATAAILQELNLSLPALIALLAGITVGGLTLAVALKRIGDSLTQSRATTRLVQELHRSSAEAESLLRSAQSDIATLRGQLELTSHAVREGTAQNERLLVAMRRRLEEGIAESDRRGRKAASHWSARSIATLQSETLQEIEALLRLRDEFPTRFESPLLWKFALSPRGMWQVVNLIRERRPSTIVELGSGLSTLYLSRCIAERPGPVLYSLEHSLEYVESTRQLLESHEAGDGIHLIHAPLVDTDVGGRTFSWYQLPESLPSEIDMLIVDGPPGDTEPLARLPAVACLIERLRPGAIIVLDDAHREDEREIASSWVRDFDLRRCRSLTPRQVILERPLAG